MARLGRSFHEEELGVRTLLMLFDLPLLHFATPFYTVSVASRISSGNPLYYGVNCSGRNISISLPAKRAGAF